MTPSERTPPSLPRSYNASPGAQRLTPEELDALKRAHPIEQVAAAYDLTLTRVGTHLVGLCPLHRETRPSFTVYPQSGTFYCFGCRQGGDVIELVRRLEGIGFVAAVDRLAGPLSPRRTRLTPHRLPRSPVASAAALSEGRGSQPAHEADRTRRLLAARASPAGQAALDLASWVYHQTLLQSAPAQAYLAGRGIGYPVAQRCRVGFCTGDRLVPALRHQGIPLEAAWAVGLLVGRARRERFAGRITIPEVRRGHTLWLTGRLLDPRAMADAPHYMSLPGPRPLLGAEAIAGHPAVVGVEGSMDWLTLVGWGQPGFAALGGALSHDAFAALAHARTIYLAFDRDGPGQEAVRALAGRLGARARRVLLPEGVKDVNELGQRPDGRDQFHACLLRAAHPNAPASLAGRASDQEGAEKGEAA
jgi:DNA primase